MARFCKVVGSDMTHGNTYLFDKDSNMTVECIAQSMLNEFGIHLPLIYGGRYSGWEGDVRKYSYDVSSLRLMEWTSEYIAEVAIRKVVQINMNNL